MVIGTTLILSGRESQLKAAAQDRNCFRTEYERWC